MNPLDPGALPFLNRDQLNFKDGATYTLSVKLRSNTADPMYITGITREGPFSYKCVSGAGGDYTTLTFKLADIPIFISASVPLATTYKNSQYVDISLQINGDVMCGLLAGYVYSGRSLSWPAATFEAPLPAIIGRIQQFSTANPAAGAEVNYTMDYYHVYQIKAIKLKLVTDANVANRRVHLNITDVNGGSQEYISSVDQAASLTRFYWFVPIGGTVSIADDNDIVVPISPDIYIQGGSGISTITTNKQAGDDYDYGYIMCHVFYADGL
jgi:hypothetical protein